MAKQIVHKPLTFGSLFAGIGGLDLGLERAGMKCLWQVEIDQFCRQVLEKHWPDVLRHDDVKTFPPIAWRKQMKIGSCEFLTPDVICGGPPCQRTSTAAAIQGVRTGETLWPEMFRVIRIMRPQIAVIEQPSGNAAWERKVADDLESAGYGVARFQRTARGSGAPHRRRRVFFIADAVRKRREALARLAESSAVAEKSWPAPPRGAWRTAGAGDHRVDDGVSSWVDRLRSLGNAVVPQTAEWIGERLMEFVL